MVHGRTRHIFYALILTVLSLFASCSDYSADTPASDGRARLSVLINGSARTILPTNITESDIVRIYLSVYDSETGEHVQSWGWYADSETGETAFAKMHAEDMFIDAGTYDFTLELYNEWQSVQKGELKGKTVVSGENTLAFTTEYLSDSVGDIELYVTWTAEQGIDHVEAGLFTDESDGEDAVPDYEVGPCHTVGDDETGYTADYIKTVSAGTYFVRFDIYGKTTDGASKLVSTIEDVVRIVAGLTTTATIPLSDINTLYAVNYELNNPDASWEADYEPVKERNAHKIVTLPTEDHLHLVGYQFEGWFESDDGGETLTGEAVTKIGAGMARDLTLYAKWTDITELYVAGEDKADDVGTGSDDTGLGTKHRPFATVQKAVSAINDKNNAETDYTILVSGKVTENVVIDSLAAKSLTLRGVTGRDQNDTAVDILDGNSNGTTLTVQTATPITIADLMITGGKTTSDNGGGLRIENGANVTLIAGAIISANEATKNGGGIWNSGSTLTINSGAIIEGNKANQHGGGIYNCADAILTLNGGTIQENEAAQYGGGVYNAHTFTMNDGTITNNTAQSGAGVNAAGAESAGIFTMNGGTISANKASDKGGGVYVYGDTFVMSGNAYIPAGSDGKNDVYLPTGKVITVNSALSGTTPVATITPQAYPSSDSQTITVLSGSNISSESASFAVTKPSGSLFSWYVDTSGNLAYSWSWLESKLYVSPNGTDAFSWTNGLSADQPFKTIGYAISYINTWASRWGMSDRAWTIYVDGTLTSSATVGTVDAASLTLCGKTGSTSDGLYGAGLTLNTSISVTVKNLFITNATTGITVGGTGAVTVTGSSIAKCTDSGIKITGNADVTVTSSTIGGSAEDANTAVNGAGIYKGGNGTLTITDSTVSGNTASANGGGIYVAAGTLVLGDGAVVSENTASVNGDNTGKGGGVYNAGMMFMYGSAVIGDSSKTATATTSAYANKAASGGIYSTGTVYLGYSDASTKATLTGGVCYNNSDGISILNGKLVMDSGNISYNYGRGVYIGSDAGTEYGNATMSGGTISGNGNSTVDRGGGVYAGYHGKFTMSGGTISGNTAQNGGGFGIANMLSTFTMSGGTISGNTATENGGGIYSNMDSSYTGSITMSGGTISGNSAASGNGVYINYGPFAMSGSALISSDNNVYLVSGKYITVGGPLSATTPVATITPQAYTADAKVLTEKTSGMVAANYAKFAVTQPNDGTEWYVSSAGTLQKVQASGISVTITPDPSPTSLNLQSSTSADGNTITFTIDGTDWTSVSWIVDSEIKQSGTSNTFTVTKSAYSPGKHNLTVYAVSTSSSEGDAKATFTVQ